MRFDFFNDEICQKIILFAALILAQVPSYAGDVKQAFNKISDSTVIPAPFTSHCLAATPPMGWNSYDALGSSITETETMSNVVAMAKLLRPHGWEYLVIDARWYDSVSSYDDRVFTAERSARLDQSKSLAHLGRFLGSLERFESRL